MYSSDVSRAKECVIFQYHSNDVENIISVRNPETHIFNIPGLDLVTREHLMIFKNGYLTFDYRIAGDDIIFDDKNIQTVEIYRFKKYDYLLIDKNKYNKNQKDFILTNIKRSVYF